MQILYKSIVLLSLLFIVGCATPLKYNEYKEMGPFHHGTPTSKLLKDLPPLDNEIMTIAVYNFMDKIVWGATAMILSEFELFISDNLKKKYI